MFETQLAQIVVTILAYDFGKIPGQPKISFENIRSEERRVGKAEKHMGATPNHRI